MLGLLDLIRETAQNQKIMDSIDSIDIFYWVVDIIDMMRSHGLTEVHESNERTIRIGECKIDENNTEHYQLIFYVGSKIAGTLDVTHVDDNHLSADKQYMYSYVCDHENRDNVRWFYTRNWRWIKKHAIMNFLMRKFRVSSPETYFL